MDATKRRDTDRWKESFGTPLPGAPNVGFRAPQTLYRFELWGACEELNLPNLPTRQYHGLAQRTEWKRDTIVYPGLGHLAV